MKKSLLLLSSLFIGLASFSQEIDLEFSNSIQNAGDKTLPSTAVGTIAYGSDRKNGSTCALKLDNEGKKGYVKITNVNSLDFTSPFSISIWFRTYNNGHQQYLFLKGGNPTVPDDFSISIGQGVMTGDITLPDYLSSSASAPTKWYHYAMVHDGDSISVYLDNVLKARKDLNVTSHFTDSALIGKFFAGSIDQFYFYSYDLSRNEVNSLYIADTKCTMVTELANSDLTEQTLVAYREGEEAVLTNRGGQDLSFQMIDLQGKIIHKGILKANVPTRVSLPSSVLVLLNATDGTKQFKRKL